MKKINKYFYNILVLTILLFSVEIIFKAISHQNIFDISSIRILFSSIMIALVVGYIELFLKEKDIRKLNGLITFLITIYSFVQVGFNNFIGVYISFNVSSQANAVLSYVFDFFKSFYWYYYFLLLPFILLLVYYKLISKKKIIISISDETNTYKNAFVLVLFLLVFGFSYNLTINLDCFQSKLQTIDNKELFKNPNNPSLAIKQFGTTVFAFLDIKNIFNENEIIDNNTITYDPPNNNIDDKKWLELIDNEEDPVLNNLNEYFINNNYTGENSYTGMFEDKNLIVIMMESVNDIIINEELYPNFYRLFSTGYYFKNNYSPRNSCATGNNELSGMIGLYSIYNKCTANAYSSNLYPNAIFNLFNDKGYKTTSMHDYTERYYARREIHTNMGSGRYYDVDDLKLTYNTRHEEWGNDEEFMNVVVKHLKKYEKNERFMTWLTTVTTHLPYGSSTHGNKYLYLFNDSKYDDYSIKLKRYMSKLKILDDGLGVLLDGLKKQGKLDDTVILLYGDHYPYGLSNSAIQDALPYSIEEKHENERVPLVIWSNNIEPNIIDKYSSYVNILPTVANLFNLKYDSRYSTGQDLFSNDYQDLVVFADGSWKNKYAFYNAANSNITYYADKEYTLTDIIKINEIVNNKIKYSNLAIQHDYFNYLYDKLK